MIALLLAVGAFVFYEFNPHYNNIKKEFQAMSVPTRP